jgi:hypothetical protein
MHGALMCHNSGLGDFVLMNGAVNFVSENFDESHLVAMARDQKLLNIRHLYKDTSVNILGIGPASSFQSAGKAIRRYQNHYKNPQKMNGQKWDTRRCFFWGTDKWESQGINAYGLHPRNNHWCETFYAAFGAPYEARYTHFSFKRDRDREKRLENTLGLRDKYSLLFDQANIRNFRLPIKSANYETIRATTFGWDTIFDWMGVIENAQEIFTIDTSWFHLIKQMRLDIPKYYIWARGVPYINLISSGYLNDDYDSGWEILLEDGKPYRPKT